MANAALARSFDGRDRSPVPPPDGPGGIFDALRRAGLAEAPGDFSVAPAHQVVPRAALAGIDEFLQVFERVTTRPAWQQAVTADAPEIARRPHPERCFFSAWDFHLPPGGADGDFQLIEVNDNGSGLLFAGLVNRRFYEQRAGALDVVEPPPFEALCARVRAMIRSEAAAFFGEPPEGLYLVLDEAEALRAGRFRRELLVLRDLLEAEGWRAAVGAPEELSWDGARLRLRGEEVAFVVDRATDFYWEAEALSPLRAAWQSGRVAVAPNPFTYATRSDKRLLALLSRAAWDDRLGIRPEERAVLDAHVPETHRVRDENLDELARRKAELVFKPACGFASRGVLSSDEVGRARLRRLLGRGAEYVAQRRVPKRSLRAGGPGGAELWTDLRVWAHRGARYLIAGRASRRPDGVDLTPPGGWIATFAAR